MNEQQAARLRETLFARDAARELIAELNTAASLVAELIAETAKNGKETIERLRHLKPNIMQKHELTPSHAARLDALLLEHDAAMEAIKIMMAKMEAIETQIQEAEALLTRHDDQIAEYVPRGACVLFEGLVIQRDNDGLIQIKPILISYDKPKP